MISTYIFFDPVLRGTQINKIIQSFLSEFLRRRIIGLLWIDFPAWSLHLGCYRSNLSTAVPTSLRQLSVVQDKDTIPRKSNSYMEKVNCKCQNTRNHLGKYCFKRSRINYNDLKITWNNKTFNFRNMSSTVTQKNAEYETLRKMAYSSPSNIWNTETFNIRNLKLTGQRFKFVGKLSFSVWIQDMNDHSCPQIYPSSQLTRNFNVIFWLQDMWGCGDVTLTGNQLFFNKLNWLLTHNTVTTSW